MSADNFDRYDLNPATGDNVREDFRDAIYNIAPTQTPFMTGCKRGNAKNTYTEWQTDDLHDVNPSNAIVDGADAGADQSEPSIRLGTTCQISDKVIRISGRAETVDKAGRSSELSFQLAKASRSIKRDMEAILTGNQGALAGNSATASLLAGLRTWFEDDNGVFAVDTTNTGFSAAPGPQAATPGTARALSWSYVDTAIRQAYDLGGEPETILMAPAWKQAISQFLFTSSARVAALYSDQGAKPKGGATAQGSVDVYISDFGTMKMVPDRFLGHNGTVADTAHIYVLDMKMWEVAYLRSFRTSKLARTGDAENRQMLVDYTLVSRNVDASQVVADLDVTLPVAP